MRPDVSVIIPVHNAGEYLRESIDSALAQESVRKEVIVVDDGSTDDTPKMLAEYGDRIQVISQPNAGCSAARNTAAYAAKGTWLAFLDQDDVWLPRKLAVQLARAEEVKHADIIYSNIENFGSIERVDEFRGPQELREGNLFIPLLLDNFITMSSAMIRRSAFERLGGMDSTMSGVDDWDLWLRHFADNGFAAACPEALVRYRWHNQSLSKRHDFMCQQRLQALNKALGTPRGRAVGWRIRRQARANVWKCSAWFVAASDRWTAIRWYLHSAMSWPLNAEALKGIVKCSLGRV